MDMLEQTVMLLMRTYAGRVSTAHAGEHLTVRLNQARLLHSVSDEVRDKLARKGIQILPDWLPAHGTNVASPLFTRAHLGLPAREIQAIYVAPVHPSRPGRTVYWFSRHFSPTSHHRETSGRSHLTAHRHMRPGTHWKKRRQDILLKIHPTTFQLIADTR